MAPVIPDLSNKFYVNMESIEDDSFQYFCRKIKYLSLARCDQLNPGNLLRNMHELRYLVLHLSNYKYSLLNVFQVLLSLVRLDLEIKSITQIELFTLGNQQSS
jgi:hypothetical protein